jgi:nicotinate-nucleotide adenylyltransferase
VAILAPASLDTQTPDTVSAWVRAPMPADGLRIGLLGGSFNPAHDGHLHASLLALKQLRLDYVWWLVSPQNPLKSQRGMAGFWQRMADARQVARHPRLRVASVEAELGTVYTIDTIAALRRRFPRTRFVWLMGSDNLLQIPRWRKWQQIFRLVPVAVVTRPGSELTSRYGPAAQTFAKFVVPPDAAFALRKPPALTILDGRRNPQSATALRARG